MCTRIGDGICCAYGEGFYRVIVEGEVIYTSDGMYGEGDEYEFSIGSPTPSPPPPPAEVEITTDDYGPEISYTLTYLGNDPECSAYSTGEVIASESGLRGNTVYSAPIRELCTGTYRFVIEDSYGTCHDCTAITL